MPGCPLWRIHRGRRRKRASWSAKTPGRPYLNPSLLRGEPSCVGMHAKRCRQVSLRGPDRCLGSVKESLVAILAAKSCIMLSVVGLATSVLAASTMVRRRGRGEVQRRTRPSFMRSCERCSRGSERGTARSLGSSVELSENWSHTTPEMITASQKRLGPGESPVEEHRAKCGCTDGSDAGPYCVPDADLNAPERDTGEEHHQGVDDCVPEWVGEADTAVD